MWLIKIIITALLIYMVVKYIIRPFLRMLLQRYIRKVLQKNMNQFHKYQSQQRPNTGQQRREGSINIDIIPDKKENNKGNNRDKEGGEYVDYEEIK
ncbi:DUF4834 family protein [Cytophagaceae bacterium ABcell3]|nr:DUF4834 family protein [Cytophagaceae bacterium ABcell3]